jgi:hypothetical protein
MRQELGSESKAIVRGHPRTLLPLVLETLSLSPDFFGFDPLTSDHAPVAFASHVSFARALHFLSTNFFRGCKLWNSRNLMALQAVT